jgi:hypothetical protein
MTVSATARNAGADTVAGLSEPLLAIVNVAGTRALLDPPAGFWTLLEDERPELPVTAGGCGLTPPELEVVAGFDLVVVVVVVVAVLVVLRGVLVVAADGVLAELEVLVEGGALPELFVLAALDVLELVDACFEPPQAAISAAVAIDAQIWIGRFTRVSIGPIMRASP